MVGRGSAMEAEHSPLATPSLPPFRWFGFFGEKKSGMFSPAQQSPSHAFFTQPNTTVSVVVAQPDDLSDIDIWMFMSIIYTIYYFMTNSPLLAPSRVPEVISAPSILDYSNSTLPGVLLFLFGVKSNFVWQEQRAQNIKLRFLFSRPQRTGRKDRISGNCNFQDAIFRFLAIGV